MRTLYIDSDFRLHTSNDDGLTSVETDLFDGFCAAYIEGHIFVPGGMTHKKENGNIIMGPFAQPWATDEALASAQAQYEADLAEAAAAYQEGVNSAYDQ